MFKMFKQGRNRTFISNIIKKAAANTTLNCETVKKFSPEIRPRKQWLLSPLLFNIALQDLARAISEEKVIKSLKIEKQ